MRNIRSNDGEGVRGVPQLRQASVHPTHQAMKVVAPFVVAWQPREEDIHHQRLAPTDAAPQIGASHGDACGPSRQESAEQPWHPAIRPGCQLPAHAIQHLHGAGLGGIVAETKLGPRGLKAGN